MSVDSEKKKLSNEITFFLNVSRKQISSLQRAQPVGKNPLTWESKPADQMLIPKLELILETLQFVS